MVLHDINQAIHYSDELIGLAQGRLVGQGDPAQLVDQAFLRELYGIDLDIGRVQERPFVFAV